MGLLIPSTSRTTLHQHILRCHRTCLRRRSPPSRSQHSTVKNDHSFKDNSATKAPINHSPPAPTHLSIPGPSWYWIQPLKAPFRAYSRVQSRRPYAVQLVSSLVIYFLGDLSSQSIQARTPVPSSPTDNHKVSGSTTTLASTYDPHRALRSVIIGVTSSIPSYHYFLFLGRSFNILSRPYLSLSLKVIFNQLCFAPLFNSYFFGMHSLLSSVPLLSPTPSPPTSSSTATTTPPQPLAAWTRIKETVPTSWWNSCKFWPVVTAFSFTFVPPQHRSVFAGCMAIGWQTYLGMLNQQAVRKEVEDKRRLTVAAAV